MNLTASNTGSAPATPATPSPSPSIFQPAQPQPLTQQEKAIKDLEKRAKKDGNLFGLEGARTHWAQVRGGHEFWREPAPPPDTSFGLPRGAGDIQRVPGGDIRLLDYFTIGADGTLQAKPDVFALTDQSGRIYPHTSLPSGLVGGAYLDVENATGFWGEYLEWTAEEAGTKLGVAEGFENKWAEKVQIQESFITAENDDIVVFVGHRYFKGEEDAPTEVGIMMASGPLYEILPARWVGQPYSLDEIIADINAKPGAPSIVIFAGCASHVLAERIIAETDVKIVIGTAKTIGLGDARELTKAVLSRAPHQMTVQEIIDDINAARGKKAKLIVTGSKEDLSLTVLELIAE